MKTNYGVLMHAYQLVCEGPCGAAERHVYDAISRSGDMNAAAEAGRRLRHETHVATGYRDRMGRAMFKCVTCGAERSFGWPESGAHPVASTL